VVNKGVFSLGTGAAVVVTGSSGRRGGPGDSLCAEKGVSTSHGSILRLGGRVRGGYSTSEEAHEEKKMTRMHSFI